MKKIIFGGICCIALVGILQDAGCISGSSYSTATNSSSLSSSGNNTSEYPKRCKAGCGDPINKASDEDDGYHFVCKPGKDGKSFMDKARNF